MQTKEILSSRNSKHTKPQSCPETCTANSRTLALPFFFRYKHIPSLKNLPSPAPNESLPYWFQGNFAASFVLKFCLREFLLSVFANRFDLMRCEPKRLMLLYYKICPLASRCMIPFIMLTLDYNASFRFETWSEEILLHLFSDLPTSYQTMSEILFTCLKMSEIVRNL